MTEKPFDDKYAFANMVTNFIDHDEFIKTFKKIINKKGALNLGGSKKSVYQFAIKTNPLVKKKYLKNKKKVNVPINSSMNLQKLNKMIK